MPNLKWLLVSEAVALDQASARTTAHSIVDVICPSKFPALINRLFISSCWDFSDRQENQNYHVQVKVTLPDGETKDYFTNLLESPNPSLHLAFLSLGRIPVSKPGKIVFQILLNTEFKSFYEIIVKEADAEKGESFFFDYPGDDFEIIESTPDDNGEELSSGATRDAVRE